MEYLFLTSWPVLSALLLAAISLPLTWLVNRLRATSVAVRSIQPEAIRLWHLAGVNYRPATQLFTCLLTTAVLSYHDSALIGTVWLTAFLAGAGSIGLVWYNRWSVGTALLVGSIALVSILLFFGSSFGWYPLNLTVLLAGFGVGAALLQLVLPSRSAAQPAEVLAALARPHRFDALVAALVATLFLGSLYTRNSTFARIGSGIGPVVLPLALTVGSFLIALLLNYATTLSNKIGLLPTYLLKRWGLPVGLTLFTGLLLLIAFPQRWVWDGIEYRAFHIFTGASYGIAGTLLATHLGRFWTVANRWIRRLRGGWFVGNLYKVVRFGLESVAMLLSLALVLACFYLAFRAAGLYGLGLALVVLLTNPYGRLTVRLR